MSNMPETVYFDPESEYGRNSVFRSGVAQQVDPDPRSSVEDADTEVSLEVDAPTKAVLFEFNIIQQLQHLPMEFGPIDDFEEAILLPSGLIEGAEILRTSIESLPNENPDIFCGNQIKPDQIEFRMLVDISSVKKSIADLAFFFEESARIGRGVQLWF